MSPPKVANPAAATDPSDDSGSSELDSIYGDDNASITDTLATFATRWTYLEGRRFDSRGQHLSANDEAQQDQMDLFHDIYFRILDDKLFLAPIGEKPQRILDCGTGTGIWAMDCADAYPSAAVIGNDLSPIQPEWVPPNCSFEVDDFNETWTHTPGSFDFVHARAIHGSVTNWEKFCASAFKVIKPGGWLEVVSEDVQLHCDDGTLPEMTPVRAWLDQCRKCVQDVGMDCVPYPRLNGHMTKAGFDMSTFKQEAFSVPIGTWPKKKRDKIIGGMMLVNMLQGIDGWSVKLWTMLLGVPNEEYQKLLAGWKEDLKVKKHHKYMKVHVTYVQKPEV